MAIADFVHLKVRSAYSLTEGANKVDKIVSLAKENAMPAVGVTDRNNLFGALEFSQYAAKGGIQPITGCEIGIRREDGTGNGPPGKIVPADWLTLLVQNETGYRNLMRLVSRAHLEFKVGSLSALPLAELEGNSEGLLALVGYASSTLGRLLLAGQGPAATHQLERLQSLFDGRLYIELQRHGEDAERRLEPALLDLAYERGVPLVATNDVHYPKAEMYEAHDVLLCIEQGAHIEDPNRRRLTPEHYFKSAAQMREVFADLPEACDNTLTIARRCAYMPTPRKPILPRYTKLADRTEKEALTEMAETGLMALKQGGRLSPDIEFKVYQDRLGYELDMIDKMGFSGYFLIVADFIQWAKDHDVPVGPGRGSGAGSLVAWALKVTDLDPLRWGLIFERFLNPERVSMPDFDIDFCQDKRDQVIRYVRDEYGHDRVAAIITFGKLQARAVLRDVGRVLGMPYGQVDRICKLVPNNPAKPVTLAQALQSEQLLKEQYSADEEIKRLIDLALQLEGLYRNASTHAAGVVIGDRPLDQLVPLFRDTDNKESLPATQFNMKWVEPAGLVKFDFLGLKTLTVIEKACDLIGRDKIDIAKLPLDDRKTYELLARGDSLGVFQIEGSGMRDVLRKLKPDRFEDIIAVVALYRPGPMENIPSYIKRKHGEEQPDYLHPLLEGILKETYGIMIYQEQVMQIAQVLSGYTLGGADLLRRAMGKKIQAEMDAQRAQFIDGAKKNGVEGGRASSIFDQVDKFAGYGFNKSHAAAYALVCYQTAYLKANHPVEFFAASMTLDMGNADKIGNFRRELERLHIPLLPPDINNSMAEFAVEPAEGKLGVRYALAAIKGVGREAMNRLTEERHANGPFKDVFDVAERLDQRVINKRLLESLVKAGAFDSLNKNRAQTFGAVEALSRHSQATHEARGSNQNSLFGDDTAQRRPQLPKVPDWSPMERLQNEFAAIGFYLSSHPLAAYERSLERLRVTRAADLQALLTRGVSGRIRLAGTVIDRQERTSAKGNRFAFVQCSDQSGAFELTVFSELLGSKRNLLEAGQAILASADGRLDGEQVKLTAQTVEKLDDAVANAAAGLRIELSDPAALEPLRKALEGKRGRSRVTLVVPMTADTEAEVTLRETYSIAAGLRDTIGGLPGIAQVEEI